jgi:hypothetical protein
MLRDIFKFNNFIDFNLINLQEKEINQTTSE